MAKSDQNGCSRKGGKRRDRTTNRGGGTTATEV